MNEVRIPETLWADSILPEGVLEVWRRHDGTRVEMGSCLADVRIEDALHEITAPADGRLYILVRSNSVIEPGMIIGRIDPC
ncbi:MAG: biotin attachment protein [Caulobacteraceae bacterium]